MKTNWTILLLMIIASCNIRSGYAFVQTGFAAEKDTLYNRKLIPEIAEDSSAVSGGILVRDTIDGSISVISDSLALDMLLSDTIEVDSTQFVITVDSVAADSVIVLPDTVAIDTLNIRKDSVKVKPIKPSVPKSVTDLHNIYSAYRRSLEKDDDRWDDIYLSLSDIQMKPVFYKYVIPLTYYSKPLIDASSIDGWYPEDILTTDSVIKEKRIMHGVPRVDGDVSMSQKIDRQLLGFYVDYPYLVLSNEARIDSLEVVRFDEMKYSSHNSDIIGLVQNNAGIGQVDGSDLLVLKPNFWTSGGNGYLQFSQNYISDNWYKGGESTKSFLSGFTWQIKYDDKQKLQYEGKFEWKLGFITAPSDTVHSYKTNNDLLRLSSKLGYKAIWNLYYTLSAEFQTQLMSNYATNSDDLISAFFSPATLNVGLGMDYKLVRDGAVNLSVLLNPINYTMYSVASNKVDPTKFNIKAGHKKEHELGSRINATLTWKMFPFLLWDSKFSYTTNYEKVFSEWENTFTFVINKYLSTKLFVHARYDDSVTPKEGEGYLQLQELFSFGLNYTW